MDQNLQLLTNHLKPAVHVQIGMCLIVADATGRTAKDPVESIDVIYKRGIYAPVTQSGTITVDGILVSVYSHPKGDWAFLSSILPVR